MNLLEYKTTNKKTCKETNPSTAITFKIRTIPETINPIIESNP